MSDLSVIDDWFDQWDALQEKQPISLEQFIEQRCQGSPPDVIEAFRSKAQAILSMKGHLADVKNPEPSTGDSREQDTGEGPSSSMDLRPGLEPIPEYRLEKKLGEGGFGQVWQATGPGGMPVALKFISLSRKDASAELRALDLFKRVRHPHLLALVGAWQKDRSLIIVMELADCTLKDRFREAVAAGQPGIPAPELLGYLAESAKGLDFLNDARHIDNGEKFGIQHRDVKPANLLLLGGGVKVGDFGLARLLQGDETGHSGAFTLDFAAPEFFDDRTSTQSDQYSLAATYCYLRSGRLPFTGTPTQIMKGHTEKEPDLSMLPEEEQSVVRRALAKQPADRWPSCGAFVAALRQAHEESRCRDELVRPATDAFHDAARIGRADMSEKGLGRAANDVRQDSEGPSVGTLEQRPIASPRNRNWRPSLRTLVFIGVCFLIGVGIARIHEYLERTDGDRALQEADAAIKKNPNSAPPYVDRGYLRAKKEEWSMALQDFNKAIELDPKFALAYARRGSCFLHLGDLEQAKKDAEEAIRLDPQLADGYSTRAGIALLKREPDAAIKDCNEAIRLDPKLVSAYGRRADAALQKNDLDQAQRDSDEAVRLDPKFAHARLQRGYILAQKGAMGAAEKEWEEALRLAPKSAPLHASLGDAYYRRGDNDRAIQYLTKAKALGTLNQQQLAAVRISLSSAYHARGNQFARKGETDKAIKEWQEAVRTNPQDALSLFELGKAYADQGDARMAVMCLTPAIEFKTLDPVAQEEAIRRRDALLKK